MPLPGLAESPLPLVDDSVVESLVVEPVVIVDSVIDAPGVAAATTDDTAEKVGVSGDSSSSDCSSGSDSDSDSDSDSGPTSERDEKDRGEDEGDEREVAKAPVVRLEWEEEDENEKEALRRELQGLRQAPGFSLPAEELLKVDRGEVRWEDTDQLIPAGTVRQSLRPQGGLPQLLVLEAVANPTLHLDAGSLLFTADRLPVGVIEEAFGPVSHPYYAVQLNPLLRS